jgi:hypothetical protein
VGLDGLSALAQRQGVPETVRVHLRKNAMPPDLPCYSCTFRAKPVHKGDKVVPPASFPAALPPNSNIIPDEPPTVSDEVLEEVCHNPTSGDTLLISVLKLHAILVLAYAPP